ncbi:MAG: RnfABCDGE type electron transport complex subunit B [Proteobacteria bacterium]|nr:RnfABCDGE type electron transport complex subunit B [Pseudomonadota bacterium]MDA1331371.1 RnfABCDGE type electron transport complex subunit B [Pseudomonadota bacterium]
MFSIKLVDDIDQILPQTQCQSCGYKDCRTYAEAISGSKENINRCAPGGEHVIQQLAQITKYAVVALDASIQPTDLQSTAVIDEQCCIGCTLCIDACPIDSIVGATKRIHSILHSLCSGCGLCLPPCPTNCIEIMPLNKAIEKSKPSSLKLLNLSQAERSKLWRERYETKQLRKEKTSKEHNQKLRDKSGNSRANENKAKRITTAMEIAHKRLIKILHT